MTMRCDQLTFTICLLIFDYLSIHLQKSKIPQINYDWFDLLRLINKLKKGLGLGPSPPNYEKYFLNILAKNISIGKVL